MDVQSGTPRNSGPGLYEFLMEAELQHYYAGIKASTGPLQHQQSPFTQAHQREYGMQQSVYLPQQILDPTQNLSHCPPTRAAMNKHQNTALHFHAHFMSELKVQTPAQLKYVAEEDLNAIGMSKPEMRRLKKYFHKHFPQNYLSKFKRMLLPKRDDQPLGVLGNLCNEKTDKLPIKVPNKHMIPTDAIIVNKELGVGEFGIVQQGVWTNDGERIQVAIKCLSRERMQNNPIEFLKEAAIMHSIDHENIVRLYGVVLDTNSLMLVTELAPLRSLLECLKEPSLRASFPILSLCDFTIQIANGMQYLEAKRLIHRDLAARNILVFSKNKVKISDFGLSRALGVGKDYYQTNFNVNLKLPIAWCAPECISYLKFTSSSDVWAFGVTLWEMFSYGFQPWAALTGHQILEAIDEPHFQRLEQPECCPKDYFSLMQQCWQHEPGKRPKFSELIQLLPDLKPEQVQAVQDNVEIGQLTYRQGDIITVLDKGTNNVFWKGILSNGKTGVFNPAHTITYLGSNLPSNKPGEFTRGDGKNSFSSQRRKIRMDMISSPQGDLKHTGHVGLDGAYFGDISFLGGKYPHVPRQIVTPYKPQEDVTDQLLLQHSKHDSTDSNACRDCSSTNSNAHVPRDVQSEHESSWTDPSIEVPPLDTHYGTKRHSVPAKIRTSDNTDHEYHEISDEENQNVLRFDKPLDFDFGPSLLDEMDQMFRTLGTSTSSSSPPARMTSTDHESSNVKNEIREIQAKQSHKKKQATVKPISAADQRTLYSAIAMAQELTARSMTDLEYPAESPQTPASPSRRRKFSFKLPHQNSPKPDRRHFSEEAASIPDIQATLSDEAKEVYNSLVETQMMDGTRETNPLRMLRSGMPVVKSRVRGKKLSHLGNITSEVDDVSELSDSRLSFDQHHIDFQCLSNMNGLRTFNHSMCLSPAHTLERHNSLFGIENDPNHSNVDENPIPLPPRDRSKTLQPKSNLPRHQRKYPLIIPGNGVSRTLAKMAICSTGDQVDGNFPLHESNSDMMTVKIPTAICTTDILSNSPEEFERRIDSALAALDSLPIGNNRVTSDLLDFSENQANCEMKDNHLMYFHCDMENPTKSPADEVQMVVKGNTSIPSLHELDQINDHLSGFHIMQIPEIHLNNIHFSQGKCLPAAKIVRAFNSSSSVTGEPKVNRDTNSDIIARPKQISEELISNPARISSSYPIAESQIQISDLSRHSDHVSCEDLLEFACDGPNIHRTRGPHNGEQSDEVRIMLKVLHGHSTPESCVAALNVTDWDILVAIKLERLHDLLRKENNFVSLEDCKVMLNQCNGDVVKTAALLKSVDDTVSVRESQTQ